jgi:DNA-binding XRE family transcriptional regulator
VISNAFQKSQARPLGTVAAGVEFNRRGAGERQGRLSELGSAAAAKAAFEAAELDPAWDRDWSCLALGDDVGPAVFVTAERPRRAARKDSEMTITAEQVRLGRRLLGWSQWDLARRIRVSKTSLAAFERGAQPSSAFDIAQVQHSLETAGVEFTRYDGRPGIRFRSGFGIIEDAALTLSRRTAAGAAVGKTRRG